MKINIHKKSKVFTSNISSNELKKLSIFLSKMFKEKLNFQLKNNFSPEFLNWLYNENPNGKAIINNVYESEKIIAHFALVPIKVLYENKIYKSALSVFTAVDEKKRGLYFFHKLASKSFELAKFEDIRFVIGVANKISSELFVKCFKFKLISPLDVKIGLSKFEEKNNLSHKFEIFKNNEVLNWRLKNPRFTYQICKEKNNFLIFNNNYRLFKIRMGDFAIQDTRLYKKILSEVTHNINPLNMWIGLNNNLKHTKMSFNLPKMLKPSPLNLIIKDLKSEETLLNKTDIKFNLIDFEIF